MTFHFYLPTPLQYFSVSTDAVCGHGTHHNQTLMMETETVSETSDTNSLLARLIAQEDFNALSVLFRPV
jgi:hypothetical protein